MEEASLRDHEDRAQRLDEESLHLFSLDEMIRSLQAEESYQSSSYTGLLLIKTSHLRVVLEVAREGSAINLHSIRGPTAIQVLQGRLRLETADASRVAALGQMVVVPHDQPREIVAERDSAFLWILALPT